MQHMQWITLVEQTVWSFGRLLKKVNVHIFLDLCLAVCIKKARKSTCISLELFSCTRSLLWFSIFYWCFYALLVYFIGTWEVFVLVCIEKIFYWYLRFFISIFYLKDILAFVLEWFVKITKEIFFLARVKHTVFVSAAQCIFFIGTSSICKTKCAIAFCICKPQRVNRAQVNQMFFCLRGFRRNLPPWMFLSSFLLLSRPPTCSAVSAG